MFQGYDADDPVRAISKFNVLAKGLVAGGALCLALVLLLGWDHCSLAFDSLWSHPWARPLLILGTVLFAVNLAALVWRIYLTSTYRPTPPCADDELPLVTVIVPAYNEGQQVAQALASILASDYPADKLQVLAVDDGSQDDTWYWMQQARGQAPERIVLVKQPKNMGKRHGLFEGFKRGSGEVFVTIDSDSMVRPDTIRNLVSPIVRDSKAGAVAGNVRVLNCKRGLIPRMLEVSFTFSFDFIRASQSRVGAVACTPGALSAYRREAVLPVLDEWLEQTFMGRPANIGEDRAMTNLILAHGHHVLFQRNAMVYTEVPTTYQTLCKMMLRWARSNVRESLAMARFIFKNFRPTPKAGARVNFILEALNLTVIQAFKLVTLGWLLSFPLGMGLNLLLGALIGGATLVLFYIIRHRSSEALWGLPYGPYNLLSLSWISTYALCTPHNSGWLTRGIAGGEPRSRWLTTGWRPAAQWVGAMALSLFIGSSGAMALTQPNDTVLGRGLNSQAGPVAATVRHNGQPTWSFKAAGMETPLGLGPITLNKVEMNMYKNGRLVSRVRADQAVLNLADEKVITLSGRVSMQPTRQAARPVSSGLRS
jgi:hyaluronan synthase